MKHLLLFALICIAIGASVGCNKNTEVTIQKDTVVVRDTLLVNTVRTDKYQGYLEIDCIVGGCFYGTYNTALTTATYYPRDSTRYNIYSGSPWLIC